MRQPHVFQKKCPRCSCGKYVWWKRNDLSVVWERSIDGEEFAALGGGTSLTVQAHHRCGCMGGTVSSASLRLAKLTPVAAPVRSCARLEVFHEGLLQCTMEMAAVRLAQVATTRWVCMGQQFTRRFDALLTFLWAGGPLHAAAPIVDQGSEGSFWLLRRRRRRYRRACVGVAGRYTSIQGHPTNTHRCDTRFAHDNPHPTLACLFNLPTLLIAFDHKML